MTTNHWVQSGENWLWTSWVGDTQVTYVIAREEEGPGHYVVQRHVGGASEITTLGSYRNPRRGQAHAEADAEELQRKGF